MIQRFLKFSQRLPSVSIVMIVAAFAWSAYRAFRGMDPEVATWRKVGYLVSSHLWFGMLVAYGVAYFAKRAGSQVQSKNNEQ